MELTWAYPAAKYHLWAVAVRIIRQNQHGLFGLLNAELSLERYSGGLRWMGAMRKKFCIKKAGSIRSHFYGFIDCNGQSHKTMSIITTFEEKEEPKQGIKTDLICLPAREIFFD